MIYQEISSNKRKSLFLIILFTIFVIGLSWFFGYASGGDGAGFVVIAVVFSVISTLISYYQGDKIALWTTGAQPLVKEDNAYVYRLVENLCIATGVPMPKVYIIEDGAINAFATGRSPEKASIAITRGAIEKLENEELEGVIAHELSHVKNYDIRFMMLVAVLVGMVSILANIFLRARGVFSGRKNDREGGQLGAALMVIGIVLAILSPLIAELIKLAVSRKREYLADASGALATRYPEGLARALEKIGAENQPMQDASSATAHLFISNPFKAKGFRSLFSTHPPIEERVKRLREMGV